MAALNSDASCPQFCSQVAMSVTENWKSERNLREKLRKVQRKQALDARTVLHHCRVHWIVPYRYKVGVDVRFCPYIDNNNILYSVFLVLELGSNC